MNNNTDTQIVVVNAGKNKGVAMRVTMTTKSKGKTRYNGIDYAGNSIGAYDLECRPATPKEVGRFLTAEI